MVGARSATSSSGTARARPRCRVRRARDAANRFARRFGGSVFPALRAARSLARRGRRQRRDRRLHAGRRWDRRGSRDARLHLQRDRCPRADGRLARPARRPADLEAGVVKAVSDSIFIDDPLRLLGGAVRGRARVPDGRRHRGAPPCVDGARDRPAGERARRAGASLADQVPPSRRGRPARAARRPARRAPRCARRSDFRLVVVFGDASAPADLERARSATRRRCAVLAGQEDPSPRTDSPFSPRTEPWALDALAFVGAPELVGVVEAARRADPAGASRTWRRARSRAWPPDRTYPRRHRRGAGSGDDLDARRGARPRAQLAGREASA